MIGSLARQTQPAEVLAAFPKLVKVLKRSVATDIPASRLPALIEAAGDQPVKVATVGFTPPTYNSGWSSGYDPGRAQGPTHRAPDDQPGSGDDHDQGRPRRARLGHVHLQAPAGQPQLRRKPACTTSG